MVGRQFIIDNTVYTVSESKSGDSKNTLRLRWKHSMTGKESNETFSVNDIREWLKQYSNKIHELW